MQKNEQAPIPNQQTPGSQLIDASSQQKPKPADASIAQESSEGKKPKKWLIAGLSVIALVIVGITGTFAYLNYQLKQQISQSKSSSSDEPPTFLPTSSQERNDLETIEWLTYTDEKVPDLIFKYPQGGTVNVKRDQPEGNYTLEMVYKDLKLEVNTIMGGIGGRSYPPRSFYSIIHGNHYEGIGKNVSKDEIKNETSISYFQFSNGGLEFGHFLIGKSTFMFSMPNNFQNKYEAIADLIACSTHSLEPDDNGLVAKAYHDTDTNTVVGVNPDQSTFTILQGDSSIDEQIDGFVISPTGEYLVIDTRISRGPDQYGRVYDLNKKEFLVFDGVKKRPKICCLAEWTSDYIFTSPDKDDDGEYRGKFEYDVKKGTRKLLEED